MFRKVICTVILLFITSNIHSQEKQLTSPPEEIPVKVDVGFYLLNFFDINDKNETFKADIYFIFKWIDKRLSYNTENISTYIDAAAEDKLKEIWWPHIEFINSGDRRINNQLLRIFPSGEVEYYIGMTGSFYTPLTFEGFPFDVQTLKITLDSFLWNEKILNFEPLKNQTFFGSNLKKVHNDLAIIGISDSIEVTQGLNMRHFSSESSDYSTYMVSIDIKRRYPFFIYEVFIPLFLVFGILCSIFFTPRDNPVGRIGVCLTCFFILIAIKFTVTQNLPQIDYLTIVDKSFLASYISIGLFILLSLIIARLQVDKPKLAEKMDKHCAWLMPILFTLIIFSFILFT